MLLLLFFDRCARDGAWSKIWSWLEGWCLLFVVQGDEVRVETRKLLKWWCLAMHVPSSSSVPEGRVKCANQVEALNPVERE